MQHTDKALAEFEAWVKSFNSMPAALFKDGSGEYADDWIQARWLGWQASRAALVILLPKINPSEWACTGDECMAMQQGISIAGRAIRAAGVKVKE